MARTYVVTGSAAGIGQATKELLTEQGGRVIGVDLRDADVIADLSSPAGRQHMVEAVTKISGGQLEGVVAAAGIGSWFPAETVVSTNYFGAITTLDGLRPLLAKGNKPRAVALASFALINSVDDAMVDACLGMDEDRARAIAQKSNNGRSAYSSSKRAISRWIRRQAPSEAWGGAGIALNGVAPGITDTPMNKDWLASPTGRAKMEAAVPMRYHGVMSARDLSAAVVWLVTPGSTAVSGQMLFVDGAADCVVRGDDIWDDHDWPPPAAAAKG
ncbi:MAG: SDR family oxidoreductase [Rhodospirillaceae bacterium]|nr:MAG: SDR family oxidoreductase [Rhodospirillaceae bacterium]